MKGLATTRALRARVRRLARRYWDTHDSRLPVRTEVETVARGLRCSIATARRLLRESQRA